MTAFTRVEVVPDTPAWEEERRNSIGASEVAAILGLSPYNTAGDVYRSKLGIDKHFDPVLSYIGHASESIVDGWITRFSGLDLDPKPGFMARSVEWPWLHASFDRVHEHPMIPIQIKTASAWANHEWDEGVPTGIQVQVMTELAVSGAPRGLVVVWIGGREFRHYWLARDDRFIHDYLIPTTRDFWDANVRAKVDPPPMSLDEVNALPTEAAEVELSESAFETLERITVLNSDITAQDEERKALKVALAQYTGTADTLTYQGRKVATWRQQKGRVGFDKAGLAAEHPDILAKFTVQGEPFRVLRTTKQKEQEK
jgi:putative phage-type endonuclease